MKQYNIPNGGYIPVDNVTYLMENDISQINKIPYLQDYEGYAVITVGPIYLDKEINIEDFIQDKAIVTNEDKNIFIINCQHRDLSDKSLMMSQKFNIDDALCNNSLTDHFSERCVKDLEVDIGHQDLHEELKKYCYKEHVYES